MAERLVVSTVICDPVGCAYLSYEFDLIRMFLIVEYYTNIDTSDWDTEEGQQALFDYMTRSGDSLMSRYEKMCKSDAFCRDMDIVDSIFYTMSESLKHKHEYTSTLSYRFGKAFESILTDKDIAKALAENNEVSEKMFELFAAYNKVNNSAGKDSVDSKPIVPGILNFAKK